MDTSRVVCVADVTIKIVKFMDKANHYIKLSEVEGILQNHVDSLFGDSCVEWSDDWGEGWVDDDDDDDEDED